MKSLKCENCNAVITPQMDSEFVMCEFCGTTKIIPRRSNEEIIFARWEHDGYYYPAKIGQSHERHVQVLFLDGDTATVQKEDIIPLEQVLSTFALEANWKNHGGFFRGKIEGRDPLVMKYDDGDVEIIELRQLRGANPNNPPLTSNRGCLATIGSIFDTIHDVGTIIWGIVVIIVAILFVIGFISGLFGG